jgi:hypothetical protein
MSSKEVKEPLKAVVGLVAFVVIMGGLIAVAGQAMNRSLPVSDSASSQGTSNGSTQAVGTVPVPKDMPPGLNHAADDGKFRFVVTVFKCGQTYLMNDNQFENATAQGQWCLMSLDYQNIGSEAQGFETSAQYVYDASGKQYSADTSGTMAANPSGSQCIAYQQVNPGVSSSCVVAFDVPKGMALTYATLHDSSFSGGVKVSLQ